MSARTRGGQHSGAYRHRDRHYEVGYGKPPVATRFKPGQSGNPRGRAKGARSNPALNEERLKSIVLDEAYRTIRVNDASGPITMPIAQAVVRSLAVNAAKGNQRAQRLFTQLLSAIERDNKELHNEWLEAAINYKVEWERELERRKKLGIQASDPVPHPDHVIIDVVTGTVRIAGPMTKEEKQAWERLKRDADQDVGDVEAITRRDLDKAIGQSEVFQWVPVPPDTHVTHIRRTIVDPKERKTLPESLTDEELAVIATDSSD